MSFGCTNHITNCTIANNSSIGVAVGDGGVAHYRTDEGTSCAFSCFNFTSYVCTADASRGHILSLCITRTTSQTAYRSGATAINHDVPESQVLYIAYQSTEETCLVCVVFVGCNGNVLDDVVVSIQANAFAITLREAIAEEVGVHRPPTLSIHLDIVCQLEVSSLSANQKVGHALQIGSSGNLVRIALRTTSLSFKECCLHGRLIHIELNEVLASRCDTPCAV